MAKITDSELLLVSKAAQEKLRDFSQGVQLTMRAGASIKELQLRVANDRLKLAKLLLKDASATANARPTLYRTTVSRAYYSMYHATRAVTYVSFGGDDHEQHSVLPTKIPADFPDSDGWKNRLKEARLDRNRADYDPYPRGDSEFFEPADRLVREARSLVKIAQQYLRSKS